MIKYCEAAQISWIFASPEVFEPTRAAAVKAGVKPNRVLVFDPPDRQAAEPTNRAELSVSSLLARGDDGSYENPNASKDPKQQIIARMFTPGTTVFAKAANISHAAQIERLNQGEAIYGAGGARHLHYVGMHHVSGLNHCQKAAAGQHQLYITESQDPTELVDLVRKFEITAMLLPPRMLIAVTHLIETGVRSRNDISSLVNAFSGGSQVPKEAMEAFMAFVVPAVGYGSTETGVVSSGLWPIGSTGELKGYVGRLSPGTEVNIIDPDTCEDRGIGVDGEICTRGSNLFSGYCDNEKSTRESFIPDKIAGADWFRTGDKGKLSGDGSLYVTGRYEEIFKVSTEEVAPAEVENVLIECQGGCHCPNGGAR